MDCFLDFFHQRLVLVLQKATHIRMSILYSSTLLKAFFISSISFLVESFGFLVYKNYIICKQKYFNFFFSNLYFLIVSLIL